MRICWKGCDGMSVFSLGRVELGGKPCVAAVIDAFYPIDYLKECAASGVMLFEIRFDRFQASFEQVLAYVQTLRSKTGCSLIGTMRPIDENNSVRHSLMQRLLSEVDALDIELDCPFLSDIVRVRNAAQTKIIVSEHDFNSMPSNGELQRIVERAVASGGDIVKIAAMANSREDVVRLLEFTHHCCHRIVSIAMGPLGAISRISAMLFGSLFTYAHLGTAVAPGQLSVRQTLHCLSILYPPADGHLEHSGGVNGK
ncbi:MAG: type I 3-dehydroquinate dehydratase [Chitinivibrionales bacterium]|nr:type I 3-dehydroquinate dehydratase [Chitinivibrionales bacterium]